MIITSANSRLASCRLSCLQNHVFDAHLRDTHVRDFWASEADLNALLDLTMGSPRELLLELQRQSPITRPLRLLQDSQVGAMHAAIVCRYPL